jgi:NAD(P)-dependent dehydrogenase (short-subunit alcohol dehydrogenase family)
MSQRVALITGGTRGIGLGIARALAREGWSLALAGLRQRDEVAGVVEELAATGVPVDYWPADVGKSVDRTRLLQSVLAKFGTLHALVNNAGRAPRVRADLLDATEDSFAEVLGTNLQGPYFLTQAVARLFLENTPPSGAIVFVTSVSAELASPNRGEYCVSKAGLSMAVKLFATKLAPHGIPVYEVRPGIIQTDMTAGVREVYDRRIADGLVPAGRWGTATDVGRTVAALLRGDVPYATGSVIHVDGGLSVGRL